MQDATATVVVFRKWNKTQGGEIIALFPYIASSVDPTYCDSYQHIGQHGAAEPVNLLRATKPATPAEYAPLKAELEAEPYNYKLDVRTRIAIGELSKAFGVRKAQIAQVQFADDGGDIHEGQPPYDEDQPDDDETRFFAGLPDPDGQNSDRAAWAQVGLEAFARETGLKLAPDADGPDTAIGDLIVDLAHYCQREGLDLGYIIDRASRMYSEETESKGTQFQALTGYALITVSGGVAEVATADRTTVDIIDYDNLNGLIEEDQPLRLSEKELSYIRQNDTADFVANVERLAVK